MAEHSLFPSILPDQEFVDDSYSKAELDRMDWDEIRRIAKEVDSDEINGHSEREAMEEYLEGHTRV